MARQVKVFSGIFLAVLFSFLFTRSVWAKAITITPNTPDEAVFVSRVNSALHTLSLCKNPNVKALYQKIEASEKIILIAPITDDPKPRRHGSKERWHTDKDGKGGAIVYVPPHRISGKRDKEVNVFLHEFVHAHDILFNFYNKSVPVRERRATFFQNIYRSLEMKPLRADYHGEFPTLDYQKARESGKIDEVADYILNHNDLNDGANKSAA